jgi:hypothetical protein
MGQQVFEAVRSVAVFDGLAFNGAFQLFNPLRRIADGQVAGRDFTFFHGMGVPYVHYPLFRAFGGTFAASELTRLLLSPISFVASFLIFFYALRRRFLPAVELTAAAVAAGVVLTLSSLSQAGYSLLGVRSMMPLIVGGILLWNHFDDAPPSLVEESLRGVGLAAALALGTEHGAALLVAYLAVTAVHGRQPLRARLMGAGAAALAAGIAFLTFLLTVSGWSVAHALTTVRFNFVEVSGDQFWYFGVPPNPFVVTVTDILYDHRYIVPVAMNTLLLWGVWQLSRKNALADRAARPLLVLSLYGVLASASYFGIRLSFFTDPGVRTGIAVAFALLWLIASSESMTLAVNNKVVRLRGTTLRRAAVALVVVSGLLSGAFLGLPRAAGATVDLLRTEPALSSTWDAYLARAEELIGDTRCSEGSNDLVWSTYTGLLEAERGCMHPDADYIIHALGQERRSAYLDTFREVEPRFVQTARRGTFGYEDWIRSTSWPWYEEVLTNYRPVGLTNHSLFWERLEPDEVGLVLGPSKAVGHDGEAESAVIELPESEPGSLIVVEVTYEVTNALAAVPVLGQLPRHFVRPRGVLNPLPVSLNPAASTVRFPLSVDRDAGPIVLDFVTESLVPGAAWAPRTITYQIGQYPDSPDWDAVDA